MELDISQIRTRAADAIAGAATLDELQKVSTAFLGK